MSSINFLYFSAGNNTGEFIVKFKNPKTSVALKAECLAKEEERYSNLYTYGLVNFGAKVIILSFI